MASIKLHSLPICEADKNENLLPDQAGLQDEGPPGSVCNLVRIEFLWPMFNDKHPDAEDQVLSKATESSGQDMPKLQDAVFVEYSSDFAPVQARIRDTFE